MKKLLVIFVAAAITLPALSQVNFGIKAGLSTTTITMDDAKTITSGSTDYLVEKLKGANYGFHAGLFVRLNMSSLYIQPELLFTSRTYEYTVTEMVTETEAVVKQNFNKLDIPLMIGFKSGPFRINAGPAASLLINSPKELIDDPDFKTMFSNLTFGYQAGIGLDILKKITLDLRYEGSLKKYQNQIEDLVGGDKFKLDDRPNAFIFSAGIIF